MSKLGDANIIKGLLIDFFIKEKKDEEYLFGSELFFGSKKRQADLLVINGYTTAFEIKSDNDDFRRVREQLDDYKKVFDYQYLVTTKHHEKKAKQTITIDEGLIIINEDFTIDVLQKPQKINSQNKAEILETVPLNYLKKHYSLPIILKNATKIRSYLMKTELDDLKTGLRYFLVERLTPRNNAFFAEKGNCTHFEDIKLLTRTNDQIQ